MRKALLLIGAVLLVLPAVGAAALMRSTGDGELSVYQGRGKVTVEARGGIIGRFSAGTDPLTEGTLRIWDLTPDDAFEPIVFGDELPKVTLPSGAVIYRGTNVRFRLVGGRYRVTVTGSGIDISAVGSGWVWLESEPGTRLPGTYSLDGQDCRLTRAKCKPLPEERTRLRLGAAEATATVPRP